MKYFLTAIAAFCVFVLSLVGVVAVLSTLEEGGEEGSSQVETEQQQVNPVDLEVQRQEEVLRQAALEDQLNKENYEDCVRDGLPILLKDNPTMSISQAKTEVEAGCDAIFPQD